jgi:hypothetical protein
VTYLNGCFRHAPGLRIRRLPEMNSCLVFKPGAPHLYTPNLSAWLLLELCPGRTDLELEEAFIDAVAPAIDEDEARQKATAGVELLLRESLIERTAATATHHANQSRG